VPENYEKRLHKWIECPVYSCRMIKTCILKKYVYKRIRKRNYIVMFFLHLKKILYWFQFFFSNSIFLRKLKYYSVFEQSVK
jgi:hypothetical protein